jgi:hypothetical protein
MTIYALGFAPVDTQPFRERLPNIRFDSGQHVRRKDASHVARYRYLSENWHARPGLGKARGTTDDSFANWP